MFMHDFTMIHSDLLIFAAGIGYHGSQKWRSSYVPANQGDIQDFRHQESLRHVTLFTLNKPLDISAVISIIW